MWCCASIPASRRPWSRDLEAQIEQAQRQGGQGSGRAARSRRSMPSWHWSMREAELAAPPSVDAGDSARRWFPALDYDRYQGELDRTGREAALKRKERWRRRARRSRAGDAGWRAGSAASWWSSATTIAAAGAHRRSARRPRRRRGARLQHTAGSAAASTKARRRMPGSKAGEVVSGGQRMQRARLGAGTRPPRPAVSASACAWLSMPCPDARLAGRITSHCRRPDRKPRMGRRPLLRHRHRPGCRRRDVPLLPGMSVRVTGRAAAAGAAARSAARDERDRCWPAWRCVALAMRRRPRRGDA